MVMPGRHVPQTSSETDANGNKVYRYGFQGQDSDFEVNNTTGGSVNYKYRMHDPRVGRFFAVDPLTGQYPHNSPYAFSENRVIDGVELEGLEVRNTHDLINGTPYTEIYMHSGPQRYTVPEGDNLEESGTPYYGNNIKGIHTMLTNTNAYQHQEENDYMIVVLHACRGGRPLMTDQGLVYSPSYAQKLSQNIDGEGTPGIVIAPDTRVTTGNSGSQPKQNAYTDINGEYDDSGPHGVKTGASGNWLVYKDGVLIGAFAGMYLQADYNLSALPFDQMKTVTYTVRSSQKANGQTVNGVNLRSGPGSSSEVIDYLKNGVKLTPTGNVQDGYMEVETNDGRKGWVTGDYDYVQPYYETSNENQ